MKRILPIVTVSNMQTAVRNAVDFICSKVFDTDRSRAIMAALSIIVFSQTAAARSGGQIVIGDSSGPSLTELEAKCSNPSTDFMKNYCAETLNRLREAGKSKRDNFCRDLVNKVQDSATKTTDACKNGGLPGDYAKCTKQIKECEDKDNGDPVDDEDSFAEEECDSYLANKCPQLPQFNNGRDYRQEQKDAERERKDVKRDVDDLLKEKQELQTEMYSKQLEMTEKSEALQSNQRKRERQIQNDIKDDLKGVADSQKKAFEDAMDTYTKMDAAYVELRAQARAAAAATEDAKDNLEVTCRAAAEAKFRAADKERIDRIQRQKIAKRNKGSAVNMAGEQKRNAAKDAKARAADYVAFYNECKGGVSPEGRAAINKINSTQRAQRDTEANLNDKAAIIEKQRSQIAQKLQQMEQSSTNAQQDVITKANERLTQLQEDYAQESQNLTRRQQQLAQEQSSKSQMIEQRLGDAQREMYEHGQESTLAKRRGLCLGSVGKRTESRQDKILEGRNSVLGNYKALETYCSLLDNSKDCSEVAPLVAGNCTAFKNPTAASKAKPRPADKPVQ